MTNHPLLAMRAGRIVAIASGKGGVGKTWLAISLSHALSRAGQRVLLFDGDLGLANVDIQLGLTPTADLGRVVNGGVTVADAIFSHTAGFDILAGRSGSGALASLDPDALDNVLHALRKLTQRYDTIVVDLGAGLGRQVRRMACAADHLLVVATDEPTSLTDAYAVLKLNASDRRATVNQAAGETGIVVNLAASRAAGQRTYGALARACGTFLGHSPRCAGVIRRDEHVRDAIRKQTPLLARHPNCAAAADVETLAQALRRS